MQQKFTLLTKRILKVYTARGRQTLCEQRKPDLTYNDAIKRILENRKDSEFLKKLAKKQQERLKLINCKKTKSKWSHDKNLQDLHKTNKFNNNNKYKQTRQRKRSLGKLESVDDDVYLKQQQFPLNITNAEIRAATTTGGGGIDRQQPHYSCGGHENVGTKIGAETLTYYLQLATDYYEQGFLKNIKYLENVGERNQLRRKRQLQLKQQLLQQQQQQLQKTLISRDLTSTTNIILSKLCSLQTERITDASLNNSNIKRQINQNNFDKYNPIDDDYDPLTLALNEEYPLNKGKAKNYGIRVNIKPQTLNHKQTGNFYQIPQEIYGIKKDCNSMNDYLNGNYQQQQQQQDNYHQQQHQHQQLQSTTVNLNSLTRANNYNYSSNVLLIDNLIDNLRELDLQENRINLPRITLTDYTHNYPTEINSDYQQYNSQLNSNQENKKRFETIILKQSQLDKVNLNIPPENLYNSEARPP